MQPPQPSAPEPEPSFLGKELAGFPVWVHLVAVIVTAGIYLLFLPLVILVDAIERSVDWAFGRVFEMALRLLSTPARILYRLLLALSQRVRDEHRRRSAPPVGRFGHPTAD
jgi:hypothetical protein